MKCELCKKDSKGNLLCRDCAEMIGRLVTFEQRTKTCEQCAAERLAEGSGLHTTAGRG